MTVTMGMICSKSGLTYTTVDDTGKVVDGDLEAPLTKTGRGEQLEWLLVEAQRLFDRVVPTVAAVQHALGGRFAADPGRYEVEGVVQVAAYLSGVECRLLATEQVRAAMGVPKAAGAYKALLARPDVAARSNAAKREQYLYALAAALPPAS